jgi:Txe/YoeB family toxin of toxin-antitoxin system
MSILPFHPQRINALTESIQRNPFEGIGKPEPLKHALSGHWPRRIGKEHRLVCEVREEDIPVIAPVSPLATKYLCRLLPG